MNRFHGLKAVAQLKAGAIRRLSLLRESGFHGLKAVAQLKDRLRPYFSSTPSRFHGLKAVAQLKDLRPPARLEDEPEVSTASKPWPN